MPWKKKKDILAVSGKIQSLAAGQVPNPSPRSSRKPPPVALPAGARLNAAAESPKTSTSAIAIGAFLSQSVHKSILTILSVS
jgi:hypothetical protein